MAIAKDRRVRSLAFNRSRVSPYPLGLGFGSGSGSAEDVKLWEDTRCPICLEIPHNAVLLRCSSFENGCRPLVCNTSYRHSNCLDQFSNSSVSSPSTSVLQQIPFRNTISTTTTGCVCDLRPKLLCPLCRGQIYGWTPVEAARRFMNNRARSCSSETCDFRGTYRELRKHARSDHPNFRPTEVDPERQQNWTRFEVERNREDMLSSTQQLDWTELEVERDREDMLSSIQQLDWTEFEFEGDDEDMLSSIQQFGWTEFEVERNREDMLSSIQQLGGTEFELDRDHEDMLISVQLNAP